MKESRSSKYIQAGVWETKKIPSIGAESQDAWLEQILARFLLTNNLEIFDSIARILRCILNSNHYHSCVAIIKLLTKQVSDNITRAKALLMVSNLIDIPSAKSVFIDANLADSIVICV